MPHLIRLLFSKLTDRLSDSVPPIELNARQADWLIRSGLLPCAHYARLYSCSNPELAGRLEAALLGYRLLGNNMLRVYRDSGSKFNAAGSPLVPLKGIDVAQAYYPQPWLRPMRDIDVLVSRKDTEAFRVHLLACGFETPAIRPDGFYDRHHHLPPLYHPGERCWLEIHTGLFPPDSPLGQTPTFQPGQIHEQLQPASADTPWQAGMRPEYRLVYIAAHWAGDLKFDSGVLPLLDMALILHKESIDWDQTLHIASHPLAAGYLLLALSLLNRLLPDTVPPGILGQLSRQAPQLNRLTLGLCLFLLDRYMLQGRSFSVLTRHTIPLFVERLMQARSPLHNLKSAMMGLLAPHHGHQPFWPSLRRRLGRLGKSRGPG